MKKASILVILVLQTFLFAKPVVVVSIQPEKTFVEKIAKDKMNVVTMVSPGESPHTYEPKPSQMASLSKAVIYFSIGVEFEDAWLDRFHTQNPKLSIIDISQNITKIAMKGHHHHGHQEHAENHEHHEDHGDHDEEEEHHSGLDPHTWTSPKNVAIMAQTIYETLAKVDPDNKIFYKKNLNAFLQEIADTDKEIRTVLGKLKPKSAFMVFHPSWSYFAKEYGLEQVAVEVEGKDPKPKEMIEIIKEAKEEKVNVIFTQPEFSDKAAHIIAQEAHIKVKKISPLAANWSENLIFMAKSIANQ